MYLKNLYCSRRNLQVMNRYPGLLLLLLCIALLLTAGCADQQVSAPAPVPDRAIKIPSGAIKMTPQTDDNPPKTISLEYRSPVPVPGPVNTEGAEDSPFILPDGNTLYFFFTPDVKVPPEKQVIDGVTGIYVTKKAGSAWQTPERVVLQDPGRLSLDGCGFVSGTTLWFCAAREGYTGLHWFTADLAGGKWTNWKNADFNPDYKVGELHISGDELYYHSDRPGGKGGLDIWMLKKVNGQWQGPVSVAAVNSERDDGWPAISPDGNELWFSRDFGLWRAQRVNREWTAPELMISTLAGEASLDRQGNVYFVHHYYRNNIMIEADIYIAARNTT
jgi:hypothetical protein